MKCTRYNFTREIYTVLADLRFDANLVSMCSKLHDDYECRHELGILLNEKAVARKHFIPDHMCSDRDSKWDHPKCQRNYSLA